MEDTKAAADAMGKPLAPNPAEAPRRQSPVDQARDAAKKILAVITGRSKS